MLTKCSKIRLQVSVLRTDGPLVFGYNSFANLSKVLETFVTKTLEGVLYMVRNITS